MSEADIKFLALLLVLGVILAGLIAYRGPSTFEKECAKYKDVTTYYLIGPVMVPVAERQCIEWRAVK